MFTFSSSLQHSVNERNMITRCNMTCITPIYSALHYVTQPNIAEMRNKTYMTPNYVTLSSLP